ncbi:hypothetical protein GUJ93_ZPchr0005g14296 [Zizania palustris]|uniref:Uncharacterized protein n=1 Tax=Zizania palustris TaxID=103762 RepID=A0A8J5S5J1_ZIZPA|nr:hypothetical protein GUJ93_ZPchr0005g14296 [Zizania palustris]
MSCCPLWYVVCCLPPYRPNFWRYCSDLEDDANCCMHRRTTSKKAVVGAVRKTSAALLQKAASRRVVQRHSHRRLLATRCIVKRTACSPFSCAVEPASKDVPQLPVVPVLLCGPPRNASPER